MVYNQDFFNRVVQMQLHPLELFEHNFHVTRVNLNAASAFNSDGQTGYVESTYGEMISGRIQQSTPILSRSQAQVKFGDQPSGDCPKLYIS
jgi:hypothetical protein